MIEFRERALLTLILFTFVAVMLFLTVNLGEVARLVPLTIVIPTLGLLIFQLAVDLMPRLEKSYQPFERVDLFDVERLRKQTIQPDQADSVNVAERASTTRQEFSIFLWMLALLASIVLFGLVIALPVYSCLYLRWRAGGSWTFSLAVGLGVLSLLYGVFILVLRVQLYEGYLLSP